MSTTTDKCSGGGSCELHIAAEGVQLSFRPTNIASATARPHVKEEKESEELVDHTPTQGARPRSFGTLCVYLY